MKMKQPWDLVDAFTPERLGVLTQLLTAVRHDALEHHEAKKGDTNWGLGCRVYERSCFAIREAVERHPWLEILNNELHFVFLVSGVPLRFGRGDHDEPNQRLLKRRPNEVDAQQLVLSDEWVTWIWRIIIETDPDTLEASKVFLIQASSDGQVENSWELALPEKVTRVATNGNREDGVALPPPTVRVKTSADESTSVS